MQKRFVQKRQSGDYRFENRAVACTKMGEVILPVGEVSSDLLSATIEETKEILAKVFSYTRTEGNLDKLPPPVKRFLEAYQDIFKKDRIPVVETPSLTQICVGTYRHLLRKPFRVVRYLPPGKLEKECAAVKEEMGKVMNDLQLKEEPRAVVTQLLEQEISWVREVNGRRRSKILESILGEEKDRFRGELQAAFPFSTDTHFHEEALITQKINELVATARESCRREVPFVEGAATFQEVDRQLIRDLTTLAHGVIRDNRKRRQLASNQMTSMVDTSVLQFQEAMTAYLTRIETLPDPDKVSEMYHDLREEFSPRFYDPPNGIEIGSPEHRVQGWNTYSDRIHCALQYSLISHETQQKTRFRQCQTTAGETVKKCMEQVTIHMSSSGFSEVAKVLNDSILKEMALVFKNTEEGNQEPYRRVMARCGKYRYYTSDQEDFLKKGIIAKLENFYCRLLPHSRSSSEEETPEKWTAFCQGAQERVLSTVPLHIMLNKSLGQDILKTFALTISNDKTPRIEIEAKPTSLERPPFQAVGGTDTEMRNGADRQVNTKHQCLTVMREYENKSLEEIRWEDYRERVVFPPITQEAMERELVNFVESLHAPFVLPFNFMKDLTLAEEPRVNFSAGSGRTKAVARPIRRAKR